MAVQTPKQKVEANFGTRGDLVAKILPLIGGDDAVRSRLMGVSNSKLLTIHKSAKTVQDKFGGKSGLIDAMTKLQFDNGKANDGWREKMEGMTVKRLLDHHRQLSTRK
ncbi:MAG: hypothetical protein ACI9MR_003522 [Myxococcota bacterium]|jgi:hypothetical protein